MKNNYEKELAVYDSNVSHDLGWIHMSEKDLEKTEVKTSEVHTVAEKKEKQELKVPIQSLVIVPVLFSMYWCYNLYNLLSA